MQRQDREITDHSLLNDILQRAQVLRLGLVDGSRAYVVPVSFGYHEGTLYVHSGPVGHKLDLLSYNREVCFEVEVDVETVIADNPCGWSMRYASIIGYGHITRLESEADKTQALNAIMAHYGGGDSHTYPAAALAKVALLRIDITSMTGKRSG